MPWILRPVLVYTDVVEQTLWHRICTFNKRPWNKELTVVSSTFAIRSVEIIYHTTKTLSCNISILRYFDQILLDLFTFLYSNYTGCELRRARIFSKEMQGKYDDGMFDFDLRIESELQKNTCIIMILLEELEMYDDHIITKLNADIQRSITVACLVL